MPARRKIDLQIRAWRPRGRKGNGQRSYDATNTAYTVHDLMIMHISLQAPHPYRHHECPMRVSVQARYQAHTSIRVHTKLSHHR